METNILSAIRDRNIFWIVIFYYLYYKAPNISSVPGSITMRDFKNNCFKKEFSLISTEKKAIVDILVFGIILRCGYCPFRFHCCFYCYVMLVVFWSLKRGRKYFRNHHNTRSTNNDLKLIFWKKKHFVKGLWVLHTMSFGNGRSPRRSFRKFSSCAQRSASADQSSSPPATATKSVVNSSSSSTPPLVSAKKRLSLKHKLPELSGSLTRVAKNVGSGLSSLASTFTTDQNTDQPTAAANTESNSSSSSSVLGQLSRENSFKMWLQRN